MIRCLLSKLKISGPSLFCLMFHRIAEVKDDEIGPYPAISIPPSTFEAIIAFCSERFHVLALPDVVAHLEAGEPLPPNSFIVTFDDGFSDTLATALPILETYEVPATVYVTTGFMDEEVTPYEFQLANAICSQDRVHFQWQDREYYWKFREKQDREQCYLQIKRMGKSYSYPLRQELMVTVLGDDARPKPQKPLFMNWQEVVALSRSSLITIGAHTHRHLLLPSLDPEEARQEIQSSKTLLESNLGLPVHHFSYPYGSLNPKIKTMVQICGYKSAVGGRPGGINPASVDRFAIPRIEIKQRPSQHLQTIPQIVQACVSS